MSNRKSISRCLEYCFRNNFGSELLTMRFPTGPHVNTCFNTVDGLQIHNYMKVQEIRNLTNELTQGMEDIGQELKPQPEYYEGMKQLYADGKITQEQFCSKIGAGLTLWTRQKAVEEGLCQYKE